MAPEAIPALADALTSPEVGDQEKGDFLVALADKGETAVEIAAFARTFRERAIDPGVQAWASRAIDIVGTGGDHAGGFNISSVVVLVLACAGVPVMKHGNRGITSKCGSADLLADIGVDLQASPETLRRGLDQLGFCFFFAPAYHPTFKHIVPVRKALAAQGRRTIFNILGPVINPGRPAHSLLGVFSPVWVPILAEVLEQLGTQAGLAAHGVIGDGRGIDELTTATDNRVRGIGRLRHIDGVWTPADLGCTPAPFSDLQGGDLDANRAILHALVAGRGPKGLEDTVVANAALGLWTVGRTASLSEGLGLARECLLGGAVVKKMAATREFFAK